MQTKIGLMPKDSSLFKPNRSSSEDSFTIQDLIDFKSSNRHQPFLSNRTPWHDKKDESPPTNRILRGITKHLDAEGVLELIQEDKYSTKSVNGSSQNQDFSKYKDVRLSRLFESIQLGPGKHMEVGREAKRMMNRSSSSGHFGTSEVFALKRELDRKSREPIILNMAVIGRKSVGKTSFIKMVLNYRNEGAEYKVDDDPNRGTTRIKTYSSKILQNDLEIKLTMIDTPGYTEDTLEDWYESVEEELTTRFEITQKRKVELNRLKLEGHFEPMSDHSQDDLIHLTLFLFEKPEMSALEVSYLKRLSEYTNVIPIYTKGDYLENGTIPDLKMKLNNNAQSLGMNWFNCKEALKKDERKQSQLLNSPLGECPPFLIINANNIIHNRHSKSYRRKYSWGTCDVENPEHTDFLLFYNLLIGYLYFPLKERTKLLYEVYHDKSVAQVEKRENQIKADRLPDNFAVNFDVNFDVNFSMGMVMGVGIMGVVTLFAKKANLL